jgi:hypothetical protein
MTALTPFMSLATSAIIGSSDGARWLLSGRTVTVTASPYPDKAA